MAHGGEESHLRGFTAQPSVLVPGQERHLRADGRFDAQKAAGNGGLEFELDVSPAAFAGAGTRVEEDVGNLDLGHEPVRHADFDFDDQPRFVESLPPLAEAKDPEDGIHLDFAGLQHVGGPGPDLFDLLGSMGGAVLLKDQPQRQKCPHAVSLPHAMENEGKTCRENVARIPIRPIRATAAAGGVPHRPTRRCGTRS
jgi:hypothetical protein